MRVLIKYLVVVGVLSISIKTFSQNERYIEVVALDTVLLKPIGFSYGVTAEEISEEIDPLGDLMDSRDPEKYKVGRTLFEIATMLKKEKFDFTIEGTTTPPLSYLRSDSSIVVKLGSLAEMERLKLIVSEESDIRGLLKDVYFESAANYQEATYTNLYARALHQAKLIAKITNNEVGKVISVSENIANGNSLTELYESIIKQAALGLYGENKVQEKQEVVKMVFRFELK